MPVVRELLLRQGTPPLEIAIFDNRGVGKSSMPLGKAHYTTTVMAQDVIHLMDHLGWARAHIVGHSMGGMISMRLAVLAPERVASLTLVSITGGNLEAVPLNWRALRAVLSVAVRSDPLARAQADLTFHFSRGLLQERDPASGRALEEVLVQEYVAYGASGAAQPRHGSEGHLHAVLSHRLKDPELVRLAAGAFPVKLVHGRHDILAAPRHAARIALRLSAPLVLLDGAHMITRDCAAQVADEVVACIEAALAGSDSACTVHGQDVSEQLAAAACCGCCFGWGGRRRAGGWRPVADDAGGAGRGSGAQHAHAQQQQPRYAEDAWDAKEQQGGVGGGAGGKQVALTAVPAA